MGCSPIKEAVRAGADAVICGAGLPVDLPELVEAGKAKIAPIVSSRRAAALLLKTWDKKYGRTADFIVAEGPEAGGHLGFSREQLDDISKIRFEEELTGIVEEKKKYEEISGLQQGEGSVVMTVISTEPVGDGKLLK